MDCGPSLLARLENSLLAERHIVAAVLSERHAVLLKDLALQLEAVGGKGNHPSQYKDTATADPSSSKSDSSQMHLQHWRCHPPPISWEQPAPPGCLGEGSTVALSILPMTTSDQVHVEDVSNDGSIWSRQFKQLDVLDNRALGEARVSSANFENQKLQRPQPKRSEYSTSSLGLPTQGTQSWRHSWIFKFVTSPTFEISFAILIVVNTLVMAAEAQFEGLKTAHKLQYPDQKSGADEIWPGAKTAFSYLEIMFGSLFTVEVFLKVAAMRFDFFKECWNIIDSIIVVLWLVSVSSATQLPVDPLLPRLARVSRLMRLLRLIRTIQLLDSLYLMTTAIRGSVSVLLWSVVLLALVQLVIALILQSLLTGYILDDSKPEEKRREVFMFYGTFARSILTMFEITLGNWMPPCRALVENVSEWYMLFSLMHKLVIGFSVVAVITSVFIQETFKTAAMDDRIMMLNKIRARKSHIKKVGSLFKHLDKNGDGVLDIEQFREVILDFNVQTWLAAMDLEVQDALELFSLVDKDGDGVIDASELVEGMTRLKGVARNYDVAGLLKNQSGLLNNQTALMKQLQDLTVLLKRHPPGIS